MKNYNSKTRQYADRIFRTYSQDVDVYLRNSYTKGDDYHPYYKQTVDKTFQNLRTIKAMIREKTADSLIIQKIGLIGLGAKIITVQDFNVSLLELSEKIVIDDKEYTPYHDAVGNKFQVVDAQFGYKSVLLFRSGR